MASAAATANRKANRKARKALKRDKPWPIPAPKPAPAPPIDKDQARDQLIENLAAMPLEQREREVDLPEVVALLTPAQHNAEKRKVSVIRAKLTEQVTALQEKCFCKDCVKNRRKHLPRYYVKRHLSFECALNKKGAAILSPPMDQEKIEEAAEREGSVFMPPTRFSGRTRTALS